MDAATADRLHEVLSRLHAEHEQLRDVLIRQQHALRRFDAGALEQLRSRGDALAERIAELEASRARLVGDGRRAMDLAQEAPEPQRSRLIAICLGLKRIAEEIASLGRINHAAARHMLDHFHSAYRMLAEANRPAAYGASGEKLVGDGALLIDAVA